MASGRPATARRALRRLKEKTSPASCAKKRQDIHVIRRKASARVADEGVTHTQQVIQDELGWVFRNQPTEDYGIDAQTEVVDGEDVRGRLLALQIKSGTSWFKETGPGGWWFRPDRDHCTVHIRIPGEARALAGYPLETAVFGDATLQAAGISLVLDVEDRASSSFRVPSKEPVRDRLRVLGLFTVPEGSSALNLRRERADLDRQFRLRAAQGRAVDLQIRQYGVTRERLKDVIAEAEGWYIIHISGHGARGALIDILKPASRRLKLVTVSACHSAARAALDNLDLLGLKPAVRTDDTIRSGMSESMLALNLAQRLRCAVVGMRFPVTDGFATELTQRLYQYLVGKQHALPHALSLAVRDSSAGDATPDRPALSRGTPAVFGSAALDLTISAPRGPLRGFQESKKKAYLGEPDARFVGRVGVMARASAALAPESGKSGVLFHGMAGAGKTSCARELAHLLSEGFQEIVWYGAPPDRSDIGASLGDLAKALATQLLRIPDLDPLLGNGTALERFLPTLTAFLRHERVLIVLDNVETLLTSRGNWRDPRWGQVIEAMTAHTGLSKVLISTRIPPAGSHGSLHVEAVHSLSLSESDSTTAKQSTEGA